MAPQKKQQQQPQHPRAATQQALITDEETALRNRNRRVVFKHVLDSPFNFEWPVISANDNEVILQALCDILSSVGAYRLKEKERKNAILKQKIIARKVARNEAKTAKATSEAQIGARTTEDGDETKVEKKALTLDEMEAARKLAKKKKKKVVETVSKDADVVAPSVSHAENVSSPNLQPMDIVEAEPPSELLRPLKSIILGINSVTAALQSAISSATESPPPLSASPRIIFLCSGDVPISQLYAHIPTMTFLSGHNVLLVPLAAGSEQRLCEALGIKRTTILAIKRNTPEFDALHSLVASKVSLPNIPWISRPSPPGTTSSGTGAQAAPSNVIGKYMPTKISTIKTSAPNMGKRKQGGEPSQKQQNTPKKAKGKSVQKSDSTPSKTPKPPP
ncbi:hypothetical protein DFS34DRAFT_619922 [Phlyctochytrium arcticum]|nr:hypothetical protein DFS34DRAFT_619922 [Phlyctochytrium arcticum]